MTSSHDTNDLSKFPNFPRAGSASHARDDDPARARRDSNNAHRARDARDPDARMDDDDDEKGAADADCENISTGDAIGALDGACVDERARGDGSRGKYHA